MHLSGKRPKRPSDTDRTSVPAASRGLLPASTERGGRPVRRAQTDEAFSSALPGWVWLVRRRFRAGSTVHSVGDLTFRDATADDLPLIVRMYTGDSLGHARESSADPLPEPYVEAFSEVDADPKHRLVVVEEDGRSSALSSCLSSRTLYCSEANGLRSRPSGCGPTGGEVDSGKP